MQKAGWLSKDNAGRIAEQVGTVYIMYLLCKSGSEGRFKGAVVAVSCPELVEGLIANTVTLKPLPIKAVLSEALSGAAARPAKLRGGRG